MYGWSSGRCLGFGVEAVDLSLGGKLPGQNHFHSHRSIQRRLPRLINDAHAAAGNFFQKFVIAEVAQHVQWRTRS